MMVGGTVVAGTWYTAILFGVSSAMLGVSGFESSSQFVEEQAKGVFVKTLRNMQVCMHVRLYARATTSAVPLSFLRVTLTLPF